MMSSRSTNKSGDKDAVVQSAQQGLLLATRLQSIDEAGRLFVDLPGRGSTAVAWLESSSAFGVTLNPGDLLLVIVGGGDTPSVALGRIGSYQRNLSPAQLKLCATESLSIHCGESSIDLRADGKVMIRGEDVLVRAKGTKRIRAGTVSIN